jgi:CRP-like cAMP-binding protein
MNAIEALQRKLASIGEVSDEAIAALALLPLRIKQLARGDVAVADGQPSTECCLVLSGFMHRDKLTADGGRQILALQVAGDVPDLQSLHLHTMDHNLTATSACEIAYIPHGALSALSHRYPDIGDLLWRDSLIDAAIFRTWIVMMGRQPAHRRLAHLLCEFAVRSAAVGLTADSSCVLPLTQADLGDALGLSVVHTNRSLQLLREQRLVRLEGFRLTILDWEGLRETAEFDPTHLHLRRRPQFDPDYPFGRGRS